VKFTNRQAREAVYAARRMLREFHQMRVYINEDLNKITADVFRYARRYFSVPGMQLALFTLKKLTIQAGQLALAARPGARRLQDRRANVQGSAWDRTGVSRTCCSCRRSAWSTVSSLCWH